MSDTTDVVQDRVARLLDHATVNAASMQLMSRSARAAAVRARRRKYAGGTALLLAVAITTVGAQYGLREGNDIVAADTGIQQSETATPGNWEKATFSYRKRLIAAASEASSFAGSEIEPGAQTIRIYATAKPDASVEALISEAPIGTNVDWQLVDISRSDLRAASRALLSSYDAVVMVEPRRDYSGVVITVLPADLDDARSVIPTVIRVPFDIVAGGRVEPL